MGVSECNLYIVPYIILNPTDSGIEYLIISESFACCPCLLIHYSRRKLMFEFLLL